MKYAIFYYIGNLNKKTREFESREKAGEFLKRMMAYPECVSCGYENRNY